MYAEYTVADYYAPFLVSTVGSALFVVILCVFIGRKVVVKFQRVWLGVIPLIGAAVYLFALIVPYAIPILEQTGDLLISDEYDIKVTAGQIERITPVENVPIYYINGRVCGADNLRINNEQYYVISEGSLTEGMLVEVRYAAFENNVILGWQEVDEDRVLQVQKENLQLPPKDSSIPCEPTPNMQVFASTLIRVGFVGAACISVLSTVAKQKIKNYLLLQDLTVRSRIVPNAKAIFFSYLPVLFFGMIIIGLSLREDHGAIVMLLALGGISIWLLTQKCTTLEIDGNWIYLRQLGKEKKYEIKDVYAVAFKPCRGFVGTGLEIVFNDRKSYWFDMDHYCGVQNVYNALDKRRK